jgi:hypothetical protein
VDNVPASHSQKVLRASASQSFVNTSNYLSNLNLEKDSEEITNKIMEKIFVESGRNVRSCSRSRSPTPVQRSQVFCSGTLSTTDIALTAQQELSSQARSLVSITKNSAEKIRLIVALKLEKIFLKRKL